MHKESEERCQLQVRAEIIFVKDLWGFLREKIETNAWNGIQSFYKDLGNSLESHSEDDVLIAEPIKRSIDAKKANRGTPGLHDVMNQNFNFLQQLGYSGDIVLLFVILILCVTCAVNVVVLIHLNGFETRKINDVPQLNVPTEMLNNLPKTDQEWSHLLKNQAARHYQVAQKVSGALERIEQSLDEAQKVLKKVGDLLKNELKQAEMLTLLQTAEENVIRSNEEL